MPLAMHKDAPAAHLASAVAAKQGKFWEFHDRLFAEQKNLKVDDFKRHAQEIGLDVAAFEKELFNMDNKKIVDADTAEAKKLGVTGTPAFFVNGRFLNGAKPFEDFAKVINEELKKKNLPIPAAAQG
jgi:protein-disulfide isomerase